MNIESARTCWVDGVMMAERDATVSIFDRGVLFADGVYEVAAAINGRLLDADLHLARLERSLAAIAIRGAQSAAGWIAVMQQLLDLNDIREGFVYLQVTRGVADRDFAFPLDSTPSQFAYARPKQLRTDPAAAGVALHSVPDLRWARRDVKSIGLLAQVLAKQEARAAGAFEALLHEDGEVTEGGSSTVWIVERGVLRTRPLSDRILAGITRAVTLELAASLGMTVDETAFSVADVHGADECLITSATSLVLPVTRVDGHTIGDGVPGRVALALRDAYLARADRLTQG